MKGFRHALVAGVGALALAALAFAPAAHAATYTASVSPSLFSFSATEPLVYRLQIATTTEQTERIDVRAGAPSIPGEGTLMALGDMTLEGKATVLFNSTTSSQGDPACQAVLPSAHGSNLREDPRMQVEIPGNSTATIALPAIPRAAGPLWPGLSLAVAFQVSESGGAPRTVPSPSPVNVGLQGVPISFTTQPRGRPGGCPGVGAPPVVPVGSAVSMGGRASGAVAGQLMTIRAAREGDSAPRDLATVRIDKNGGFGYRWRPTSPGAYALGARYRSQSPKLADDFSPATTLRVAAAPAATPRSVGLAAKWRVVCRGRRCSIRGGGTVTRPKGAQTRCTGKVRLRVTTKTKRLLSTRLPVRATCRYRAARRFKLRSTRTRAVAIRLSYSGDPAYRPRTARAVRIDLRP